MKDLLINVLNIKHQNMLYSIKCLVEEKYKDRYEIFENENYLFLHNKKANVCLVSHVDTIKRNEVFKLSHNDNVIYAENSVLGADDRAGNSIALSYLEKDIDVSLLFTDLEETGCIGAKAFSKNMKDYILNETNINLFIELDRRGSNCYVCYCDEHDYEDPFVIEGFNKERGSVSDVKHITDSTKIPHVNLGVGYYNEHTTEEYLDLQSFYLTVNKLDYILNNHVFNERIFIKDKVYKNETTKSLFDKDDIIQNNLYEHYYGKGY
jgi:hypothetical protein